MQIFSSFTILAEFLRNILGGRHGKFPFSYSYAQVLRNVLGGRHCRYNFSYS
jgi:hypothetical protein